MLYVRGDRSATREEYASHEIEPKRFEDPDETCEFANDRTAIVSIGGREQLRQGELRSEAMTTTSTTVHGDGFVVAPREELERTGNWTLVRRSLGCRAFGVNLVEIPPGESIPEHDETERDQEELFFVLSGTPALVIEGQEHPAPAGTFVRLDPHLRRTVRNVGSQPASVLIISAPTTSGYTPMEWA
jgi:quercetin dioxygenase-like cupin family protein